MPDLEQTSIRVRVFASDGVVAHVDSSDVVETDRCDVIYRQLCYAFV